MMETGVLSKSHNNIEPRARASSVNKSKVTFDLRIGPIIDCSNKR